MFPRAQTAWPKQQILTHFLGTKQDALLPALPNPDRAHSLALRTASLNGHYVCHGRLVRALKNPSILQLLLCELLPPLSRHTAATAAFTQRALDARFVASLLDLLCGRAAAETKQHAARLLAALGGNPSGGSAIRAELEKVEVWSTYSKIPPSNTGNDILRLRRALNMDATDSMALPGLPSSSSMPASNTQQGASHASRSSSVQQAAEPKRAATAAEPGAGVGAGASVTQSQPLRGQDTTARSTVATVPAAPLAASAPAFSAPPPPLAAVDPGDDEEDFESDEEEYVD